MSILCRVAFRAVSPGGKLKSRGWHLLGRWGAAAALCAGLLVPAGMQAQTAASFSGTMSIVSSAFQFPTGVAVDRSGNVFVADQDSKSILEIVAGTSGAAPGTVNGNSVVNPVGIGLRQPASVAVDGSGNVFVGDDVFNNVYEIDEGTGGALAGTVNSTSTVHPVGSFINLPPGVAVDGSGNVFVVDRSNNSVKEIVAGTNGAAPGIVNGNSGVKLVGSGFRNPLGVAVDGSGNVFVADDDNHAVKEILVSTGTAPVGTVDSSSTVTTLNNSFYAPTAVAVDGSGNVFVADSLHRAVNEIVAGTGSAPAGTVNSTSTLKTLNSGFIDPYGIAVGRSGNVFVIDTGLHVVAEIQPGGVDFGSVAVATTAPPTLTLQFTFTGAGTIGAPAVLTQGAVNKDFTDAGTGSCTTNGIAYAYAVSDSCTVDVSFNPKHPGPRYGGVELFNSTGTPVASANVYGTGTGPQAVFYGSTTAINPLGGGFRQLAGVALDGSGNVYVTDNGIGSVMEIPAGCTSPACVKTLGDGFLDPVGGAVDGSGNFYFIEVNTNSVMEIPAGCTSRTCMKKLGGGFSSPGGLAVDGSGNLYVTDVGLKSVTEMSAGCADASCVKTLASGFSDSPFGVAVDGSGNVYVADISRVLEIPAGCASEACQKTLFGYNGSYLLGVAVDAGGSVYVADYGNGMVTEIPAGCALTSCAKTLGGGFSRPVGVAVDGSGNVYVADSNSTTVKEIALATPPTLTFATATNDGTTDTTDFSNGVATVTLFNDGNAPLMLTVPGTGTNPSVSANFTVTTTGSAVCPSLSTSSFTDGTLAAGASCDLPISFTPVAPANGAVSGSVVVTDNSLNALPSTMQSISLMGQAVEVLVLTPSTLSNAAVGVTYSVRLSTSGGPASELYSYTSTGVLPAGITLSLGGLLSGMPTAAGMFSFNVTSTDQTSSGQATQTYTLNVVPPTIALSPVSGTNLTGTAETAFTQSFLASGGTSQYSYVLTPTAGTMPKGLSFSTSTGVLGGTPTTSGTISFTITAKDSSTGVGSPFSGTGNYTLTVGSPTIMITPGTLSGATVDVGYSQTLSASGGTSPYNYQETGVLPAGITLSAMGGLSGTPTAAGTFSFMVTATDSNAFTGALTYTLNVAQGTPVLSFAAVPTKMYGNAPFTVTASSKSAGAVTYSVVSGPATVGVSSGLVTLTGAGTVTIEASQAATANYQSATDKTMVVVSQQASATSVSALPLVATPVQAVTLTATVAATTMGTAATPSGTVTFLANGVQLGQPVNVVSGVATMVVPSLPAGATTVITAVYSGDVNFTGSTSSNSASVVVAAFDLTFTDTGSGAYTVAPGVAAVYDFGLAPLYGRYSDTVSFNVTGLPAGATASFTPSSLAVGSGATPVTMTVQTVAAIAQSHDSPFGRGMVLALLLLPFVGKRSVRKKIKGSLLLFVLLTAGLAVTLTGCSAKNGFLLQSPHTYTLTVTATSGTLQHSQTVTLIVQ